MTAAPHARSTRCTRATTLAVASAIAALLLLPGCSSKTAVRPEDQAPRVVAPSAAQLNGSGGGIHGSTYDRLDDASEPSLTLDDAIARAGIPLSLPDERLTGKIVKVVLNETVTDPSGKGRVGVLILFESGIKLCTEPGSMDLKKFNERFANALPFRDGRKLPCELKPVGGRATLVGAPGIQYNGRGEIATPATLIWNIGDVNYLMKAPVPPLNAEAASTMSTADADGPDAYTLDADTLGADGSLGVDDLVRMAESLAPVGEPTD